MRRKLKNLKNKSGHSDNGAPRALIDLAFYRERMNNNNVHFNDGTSPHFDSRYSGWSNGSRPRDSSITLQPVTPKELD